MALVAGIFLLISGAVAVLGFSSAKSDIQIIIGLLGLLFSGVFLTLLIYNANQWSLTKSLRKVEKAIGTMGGTGTKEAEPARADAATDFNGAVLLYQQHNGHKVAGDAIRELADEALRTKGFLR